MKRLLPEKIMRGYARGESGNAKVMKIGTLSYSLAEIVFENGKKRIKILLFDYASAQIMYDQSVKKFKTFEAVQNDSIVIQTLDKPYGQGWQTNNVKNKSSQIALGVNERFYLSLEGAQVELEELLQALDYMPFQKLPQK
jgi:hypothetical protein